MNKKIIGTILLSAAMLSSVLTGCGNTTTTDEVITSSAKNYVSKLEDGKFYVRHKVSEDEYECTPVYFGNGTFEEETTPTTPSDDRVLWYKDDFEKIPTLYPGDSLIMHTTAVVEEKMVFERFEDYGYTIGICGMEELKSGRYKIYTDKDKNNTYPYGDTDEILKLENKYVVLESIGDKPTRASHGTDQELQTFLTRSGTIRKLEPGKTFKVVIYEGTVCHEYYFTSNIRAFGSMEVVSTYDYEFEDSNLLRVDIPEYFNSGYYMINGIGLFRYVSEEDMAYVDNADFNKANVAPDENTDLVTQFTLGEANDFDPSSEESEKTSTFTVQEAGDINVVVSFTIPGNYGEGDGLEEVTAIIKTPSGGTVHMINQPNGTVSRSFAAEAGAYTIEYYNIDIREPHVEVSAQ
nr:hypothetical protein [uncultured Butyrivibrio sp.]